MMPIDVTHVSAGVFARSRGPDQSQPGAQIPVRYGIKATMDGKILEVELTFLCKSVYCCYEHCCHLPLFTGNRWDRLRQEFSDHGVAVEDQLELRLTCIIQDGAVFFDFSKPDPNRRGWYGFKAEDAYQYRVTEYEGITDCDTTLGQRPNSS
jgi:hypothetical protein